MGRIEGYGFRRKAAITLLSVALGYSSQFKGTVILPSFCQRFVNPHNVTRRSRSRSIQPA